MIQDIFPRKFNVEFRRVSPRAHDLAFIFNEGRVLLKPSPEGLAVPSCGELNSRFSQEDINLSFLFAIDEVNFFSGLAGRPEIEEFVYHDIRIFREIAPPWLRFAGVTAAHVAFWRNKNRFCGHCGSPNVPSPSERALICPACGNVVYPSIAPVVIVGVRDGERLLLTRHVRDKKQGLALVAGFVEIGETLEDAARREVYEETGVKIKNIHYYKSQPWAFSQALLTGFFAELDGPDVIDVDREELSEALWVARSDLPQEASGVSLTYDMIDAFRLGRL